MGEGGLATASRGVPPSPALQLLPNFQRFLQQRMLQDLVLLLQESSHNQQLAHRLTLWPASLVAALASIPITSTLEDNNMQVSTDESVAQNARGASRSRCALACHRSTPRKPQAPRRCLGTLQSPR